MKKSPKTNTYRVQNNQVIPVYHKKRSTTADFYNTLPIPANQMQAVLITDHDKISYICFRVFTHEPIYFHTHPGTDHVTYADLQSACTQVDWTEIQYTPQQIREILDYGRDSGVMHYSFLRAMCPDLQSFREGLFSIQRDYFFLLDDDDCLAYFEPLGNLGNYITDTANGESCPGGNTNLVIMTAVHPEYYITLPPEYTHKQCPEISSSFRSLYDNNGDVAPINKNDLFFYTTLITSEGQPCELKLDGAGKQAHC